MATAAGPPSLEDGPSSLQSPPYWRFRTDKAATTSHPDDAERALPLDVINNNHAAQLSPPPPPLSSPGGKGGGVGAGAGGGRPKRPWWKNRWLLVGAGTFLIVIFIVLLVLGLLGYLRKVGPFAPSLAPAASRKGSASSLSSFSAPENPLSTIPLLSDPFATPVSTPAAAALPTTAVPALPTQTVVSSPPPVRKDLLAGNGCLWFCCGFACLFPRPGGVYVGRERYHVAVVTGMSSCCASASDM